MTVFFSVFSAETSIRSNDRKQQTICWPRYSLTVMSSLKSTTMQKYDAGYYPCVAFTKACVVQHLDDIKEQSYSCSFAFASKGKYDFQSPSWLFHMYYSYNCSTDQLIFELTKTYFRFIKCSEFWRYKFSKIKYKTPRLNAANCSINSSIVILV